MIPGEILTAEGTHEVNAGAPVTTLMVANTGDRPVQVGSHYHFAEANAGLEFDRAAARGLRHPRRQPGWSSTAPPRAVCGWTSPQAPPCASSPASAARSRWSPMAGRGGSMASTGM